MDFIKRSRRFFAKIRRTLGFSNSSQYWIERYQKGRDSGIGSYGKYAEFKAEIINDFIQKNNIDTVIEFGCGDGNQLRFLNYPGYLGLDISPEAIDRCREIFQNDPSKSFKLMREYDGETAELTVSLDVIFHLVEDSVFESYMTRLFDASTRFVLIYSSNTDKQKRLQFPHVKHRKFTDWIEDHTEGWYLMKHIPNKLHVESKNDTPPVDFYIYRKVD